jgi:hypothetical protein
MRASRSRSWVRSSVEFSSSGRGLGIHQPGSNTRGGRSATPAPSGRARDRAKCPAAARSSSLLHPFDLKPPD